MASWPILSVTTFLPLAGVLFLAMLKVDEADKADVKMSFAPGK